jgi:2,3-bisphosphoglycerate-dependent phosphoglycerate mutase
MSSFCCATVRTSGVKLNLFTGWKDVALSPIGTEEARRAGRMLKQEGYCFDLACTSALKRAQHMLKLILEELGQEAIPIIQDQALNERDYGDIVRLEKGRERWVD